jgi:hypothetical protein
MPTLVRFLVVVIVLAAIGIAGMFYLANFVEPHTREMTVKVPADRLQPKDVAPPPAVAAAPATPPAEAAPATPVTAAPASAPAAPSQPRSRLGRQGRRVR